MICVTSANPRPWDLEDEGLGLPSIVRPSGSDHFGAAQLTNGRDHLVALAHATYRKMFCRWPSLAAMSARQIWRPIRPIRWQARRDNASTSG